MTERGLKFKTLLEANNYLKSIEPKKAWILIGWDKQINQTFKVIYRKWNKTLCSALNAKSGHYYGNQTIAANPDLKTRPNDQSI